MTTSWRDSALQAMFRVHAEQLQAGANPQQIADAIDKAYPFGERRYWPYKAWLSARKHFFALKGLPNKRTKPKHDLLTQLDTGSPS